MATSSAATARAQNRGPADARPKDYAWSSYRHCAFGEPNPLIDDEPEYSCPRDHALAERAQLPTFSQSRKRAPLLSELPRGRVVVPADGQPAAMEHLRQPAGDPVGEGRNPRSRWEPA